MRIPNLFSIPWKSLSWAWVFALFCIVCAEIHFLIKRDINTDLMSMVPQITVDDARTQAQTNLTENLDNRLIFLVGFPQERRSEFDSLFEILRSQWRAPNNLQQLLWESLEINSHLDFYRSISARLMNVEDQRIISLSNSEQLLGRAVATFDSVGNTSLISKSEDPFGFFGDWLTKRLPKNTFLPTGKAPKLFANHKVWGVLLYQDHNPNNITSARQLLNATADLQALASGLDPQAQVYVHGQTYRNALFVQSSLRELVAVVIFSLLGIATLARLLFKRSSAVFGIFLCGISSYICACFITTVVFHSIHLWTILVGAFLLGLSSAYAGCFYSVHQNKGFHSINKIQQYLGFRLGTATLVGITATSLLIWAPLHTIQQLAVFLISGAVASFLTTVLVLPYLSDSPNAESESVRRLNRLYQQLPILTEDRWIPNLANSVTLCLVILFVILGGVWKLNISHDIRNLTNFNLQQRQIEEHVEKLLALPSTEQYFIVHGATKELTLMNEEALQHALDRRDIPNVDLHCITKWFPSETRRATIEKIKQEAFEKITQPLQNYFGFKLPEPNYRTTTTVTFDDWYASPASRPMRHLWMTLPNGYGTIVQIAGLSENNRDDLNHLSQTMAGVSFVDTHSDYNQLLAQYRTLFIGLFFLIVVVFSTITLFYFGLSTWRVVTPPVLGIAIAISIIAWLGFPFKFFSTLSIIITFGISFNFSLLLAKAEKQDSLPFVLTTFASWSLIISSILLMACMSPAIQTFGLTVALGLFFTWILTPLMRRN